jgi:hypothetical protein
MKHHDLVNKKWRQRIPAILGMVIFFIAITYDFASAQSKYDQARRQGTVTPTEITRAQLLAMQHNDLRLALENLDFYKITDLVNASAAQLSQRQENIIYMTVDLFYNSDLERKMHVLNNPSRYVIVKEQSMIPKATVSRAHFNTLSPEKKQSMLNSGDFIITD